MSLSMNRTYSAPYFCAYSRPRLRASATIDDFPTTIDIGISFTALVGTLLVGSVRVSPARAGTSPLLVLGPLTVDPAFGSRGIGGALMRASLDAARSGGHGLVILVGDAPYYARFGFAVLPPRKLTLPGPVDPGRFLALELREGALAEAGGSVVGGTV